MGQSEKCTFSHTHLDFPYNRQHLPKSGARSRFQQFSISDSTGDAGILVSIVDYGVGRFYVDRRDISPILEATFALTMSYLGIKQPTLSHRHVIT